MKKVALVFIVSFVLALGIFLGAQYYLSNNTQQGALQVTSSPRSKVYLNNQYLGQTPMCKCDSDTLDVGEYTIRLVPLDSSLQEFQEKITVSQGVLTVVDRKFGKNAQSEGSIISLSPLEDKTKAQLLVVSFPQDAQVLLDDQTIGKTPILYKKPTESDHDLKVSKEGYNEKEIPIRTPLGYKVTVAVYLSVSTTDLSDTSASNSATPTAASSTPSPSANKRVTILNTPIGILKVREGPSLSATEVGQAIPGKSYTVVGEEADWYEISLDDGTVGWVSSRYAKKN
ncbi:MAG: PEGA domain-containing protein [Candidatus Levyibacteriota bacterium]